MTIGLCVVNYRTPRDLVRFIESYLDYAVSYPLVVIDVQPDDEVQVPVGVMYRVFHDNLGYARSCNYGGSFLISAFPGITAVGLFNADTRITPGIIQGMERNFAEHPDWGVIGPRQTDSQGRLTHAGIFGTPQRPAMAAWQVMDTGEHHVIRDDAVSVSGAAYFVRATVWEDLLSCRAYKAACASVFPGVPVLGPLLPTQHYYEEMFCSLHARSHGSKVVYDGTLHMYHEWHKSSPIGGERDLDMPRVLQQFRAACDLCGIEHE